MFLIDYTYLMYGVLWRYKDKYSKRKDEQYEGDPTRILSQVLN